MQTSRTGTSVPVVRISRHRSRAWARSWRPSTSSRSESGASSRALPSAGRILTWWPSSASAGQHLGGRLEGAGEKQERAHEWSPPGTGRGPKRNAGLRPVLSSVNNTETWASHWKVPSEMRPRSSTSATGPSARSAAGVGGDDLPVDGPDHADEVVRRALALHPGTRCAEVLQVCSTLVGDRPVNTEDPGVVVVAPGSSVEFLPPFAGG